MKTSGGFFTEPLTQASAAELAIMKITMNEDIR